MTARAGQRWYGASEIPLCLMAKCKEALDAPHWVLSCASGRAAVLRDRIREL